MTFSFSFTATKCTYDRLNDQLCIRIYNKRTRLLLLFVAGKTFAKIIIYTINLPDALTLGGAYDSGKGFSRFVDLLQWTICWQH